MMKPFPGRCATRSLRVFISPSTERRRLSTLQRALDARGGAVVRAGALVGAIAGTVAEAPVDQAMIPHFGAALTALAAAWLLTHAWSYRDIVAAQIAPNFPRAAAWLRSR